MKQLTLRKAKQILNHSVIELRIRYYENEYIYHDLLVKKITKKYIHTNSWMYPKLLISDVIFYEYTI